MNKWIGKMQKFDGAVTERKDRYKNTLKTLSPSVNYIFGKGNGLPRGYQAIFYGLPKGGKSVLSHMFAGYLHQTDPDAIVLKFDTEYRADTQLDSESCQMFGIDEDRLQVIQTNSPSAVFDQIEKDVGALVQAGMPLKLIVIDSVSGIQGRREMNADSVEKQLIGDHAQTIQNGMKRILPVIRQHDIAVIVIAQARAQLDQDEVMRGNTIKMQGAYGLQHACEYFIAVEENRTQKGRKDILGREFVDESVQDLAGRGQKTGMKIRARMINATIGGGNGRTAEFTWNFKTGYVNRWEEIVRLARGYGLVHAVPGAKSGTYAFGNKSWYGEANMLKAIEQDEALQNEIIEEFTRLDEAGELGGASAPTEATE